MKREVLLAIGAAALLAGAILAWNAVRQEREFRRLLTAGDVALARNQTFDAIEAFSGALALKNDSMVAHLKRGDSYLQRGELAAALRDLRDAADLDPTAPRPAELLGDVNMEMGRFERASEHYRRFITLDDRAPRVLYKLALAYVRHGQCAKALEPLRRAVALDERLPEGHLLLGVCLRESGRPAEAVRVLERAVALAPALAAARAELAELYGETGRTRDRIEQLEALAALEPGQAERWISIGLSYARTGRIEAAVSTLRRAAERYPDNARVQTALGRVWLDVAGNGDDREAVTRALDALEPAATRVTASSETMALYGRALLLSGNADAAELVLRQAVMRMPVEPTAFLYLAQAAERLRHTAIAEQARERYAALASE